MAGGGMSMIAQDMQGGTVDWWQVLAGAAIGAATGGVAAGVGSAVSAALGRAVASQASNAATSAAARIALSNAGRAAISQSAGGAVSNTGVYLATKDPSEWSARGIAGAAAGGAVAGAASSQATIVTRNLSGIQQAGIQNVVAGGGSLAGGAVDNWIAGSGYTREEMLVDAGAGVALSHLPSATKLTPAGAPQGWSPHAVDGFLGGKYNFAVGVAEQAAVENGMLAPQ